MELKSEVGNWRKGKPQSLIFLPREGPGIAAKTATSGSPLDKASVQDDLGACLKSEILVKRRKKPSCKGQ